MITNKIIYLIISVIILLIFGMFVFKLFHLNKKLFPCSKENYYTNSSDSNFIEKESLNFIISAYNDICGFDIYKPTDVQNISYLNATIDFYGFKTTNKAGLIYEFEDKIHIVFRGTSIRGDELIDADIRYYTYPGTNIKVHKGFYKYYLSMKDQIANIIKNKNKQIYITGHSLGASVALITAYDLKDLNPIVTLFGCPKTGNKDFVDSFTSIKTLKNIVNYFDIVPEAPEKLNKMYAVENIYIFGIEQDSDVKNHSLGVYYDGINCMQQLNICNSTNSSLVGGTIPKTNKLGLLF